MATPVDQYNRKKCYTILRSRIKMKRSIQRSIEQRKKPTIVLVIVRLSTNKEFEIREVIHERAYKLDCCMSNEMVGSIKKETLLVFTDNLMHVCLIMCIEIEK